MCQASVVAVHSVQEMWLYQEDDMEGVEEGQDQKAEEGRDNDGMPQEEEDSADHHYQEDDLMEEDPLDP